MIDDDDIPDFIVGSGSEHHVSVSEHTGNAKTPHNKVVSHEEEALARKLAFEHDSLASEAHKTPGEDHALGQAHLDAHDPHAADNVQKIAADKASANHQTILEKGLPGAKVQNIATEVTAPNRQGIHTDTVGSNYASIAGPEHGSDNKPKVPADTPTDNNRQKVGSHDDAPNVQGLASDAEQSHRVGIHTEGVSDNHQALPAHATTNNRQPLPSTAAAAGASAAAHPSGVNEQQIPTLNETVNHQPIQDQSLSDNRQALGGQTNSPNHQAAPQAPEPGANRQPIGTQATQDHREAASGDPIERAKVDFPKAGFSGATDNPSDTPNAALASKANKKPRAGVTLPGLISDPAAASPEVLDAAAEFHRRVLDIKNNVDNLNHRLSDFEQNQP